MGGASGGAGVPGSGWDEGMSLTQRVCARARELGFDLVGVAPAAPPPHLDAYRAWLARGYHGEMGYLARPDRVARREDLSVALPGVRSVICVALNYYTGPHPQQLERDPSRGLISNYAWGRDYHALIAERLERLAVFLRREAGGGVSTRVYVDTGPVLERAYAVRAGLGFIGKNTCLIHPRLGSWLFLGEILVDVELQHEAQAMRARCGTCRRCLDACPTGALVAPRVLDARLCISYLTVELKGAIPRELRPLVGNRIFGCDVCQAVCPWQRFARPTGEASFQDVPPERSAPALLDLIELDEDAFRQRYSGSPVLRAGRRGLLRNVAVALGNWGDGRAVPALAWALGDAEPLIRGHAAWALGCIGGRQARESLQNQLHVEADPYVRDEVQHALATLYST